MPMLLVAIYVVVGCGTAVFVLVRRLGVAGYDGPSAAVLMIVLWPFFLPTLFAVEPVHVPTLSPGAPGPMAERIERVARSLREASGRRPDHPIERAMLDAFVDRLRRSERGLREMDQTISGAPSSIRGQLEAMRDRSQDKLAHDVGLLEELVAQLTVLRFAEMTESAEIERDDTRIRGLLGEIKALVELSADSAA